MTIELKYVALDNGDLQQLVAQLNDFFFQEWGAVAGAYQSHHDLSKMVSAVVAYVEEQPAGCGCWKLYEGNMPTIKRMFVSSDFRGNGLASKILGKLEADIKNQGHSVVNLETGREMAGAIAFYQKKGYQIIPNYGEFVGDELCVCLQKELN